MKFIDVNIVRLEKNGFGRLQPVWSRGLVNTGEIKSLREGYPPEGMEGRVCILQMTDGSEITVKASMEYVKHELAAASVHTHTNFDEEHNIPRLENHVNQFAKLVAKMLDKTLIFVIM